MTVTQVTIPEDPERTRTAPNGDEVVRHGHELRPGMVILILNPTQRRESKAASCWAKIIKIFDDGMLHLTCEYADGTTTPSPRLYSKRHAWLVKRWSLPKLV